MKAVLTLNLVDASATKILYISGLFEAISEVWLATFTLKVKRISAF